MANSKRLLILFFICNFGSLLLPSYLPAEGYFQQESLKKDSTRIYAVPPSVRTTPAQEAARNQRLRNRTTFQMVVTVVPLVFAVIHFLLFSFYPRHKGNLYYAAFTASAGATEFFVYQNVFRFFEQPQQAQFYSLISDLFSFPLLLFGLLFLYTIISDRTPKQFLLFLVSGIGLAVWMWSTQRTMPIAFLAFSLLVLIEMSRIIVIALRKKKGGAWIVAVGFFLFILTGMFLVLFAAGVLKHAFFFQAFWIIGVLGLLLSMSIYLARDFAHTNRDLAKQLIEVKDLSKKTLRQEREAKQREIEQELLQAENERQTKELEEARLLQLSMLPKEEPVLPGFEIAAAMKTANEVGGDYYDFVVSEDGSLTVAIGDATGHGTRAGMMVTSIKTLFSSITPEADIVGFFHNCTRVLKGMQLGNLYMSMTVAKFTDHKLVVSAAGMPPVLIHRIATGAVEEVVLKGMPLASVADFPYQQQEISLASGDTILLCTDGFEELFNQEGKMLNHERVKKVFREGAEKSPASIIRHLLTTAKEWSGTRPQDDDMTFVVVRKKAS